MEGIIKAGREGCGRREVGRELVWRGSGKEEVMEGITNRGREGGRVFQREGGRVERGREREGGYYKGREGGRKGGMDGWKDGDREGRYYKGSGEASRVLQMEGWREGEGGRVREGEYYE